MNVSCVFFLLKLIDRLHSLSISLLKLVLKNDKQKQRKSKKTNQRESQDRNWKRQKKKYLRPEVRFCLLTTPARIHWSVAGAPTTTPRSTSTPTSSTTSSSMKTDLADFWKMTCGFFCHVKIQLFVEHLLSLNITKYN